MKYMLTILLLLLSVSVQAQRARFEATVVDADSHEVLPFASVFVTQDVSTITNAEGSFAIICDSTDVLRISYVGYKTVFIPAAHLRNVVTLAPQETLLQEVLVVPIGPMIDKICKETLRMMRKYNGKRSQFFYRQTAFSDATCYEFAEAFLTGGTAVTLHDLRLLSGRYAGVQSDSMNTYAFFGNFYTFSQLEVAAVYAKPRLIDDVVPLFRNYDMYYDVSYEVTAGDDDSRIFVIHFNPKLEALEQYAILEATLYVDEQTLHLRRIVGEGRNFRVMTKFQQRFNFMGIEGIRNLRETHNTDFSYVIDLSDERGFPEVQSAFVEAAYQFNGKPITTRSLLYNIGEEEVGRKGKRSIFGRVVNFFVEQYKSNDKETLYFDSELHKKIESMGYDPDFWDRNEIVRRTPIEQDVLEMFEQQDLFGVMSTEEERYE